MLISFIAMIVLNGRGRLRYKTLSHVLSGLLNDAALRTSLADHRIITVTKCTGLGIQERCREQRLLLAGLELFTVLSHESLLDVPG